MNTPPICPECGNPLPPESSHDVCPACLLAQGMLSGTGGLVDTTTLPDLEEMAGKFPQFEILECLGRGGMGVVYKARQKSLNRVVAIKVIAPERKHDAHFAARFSREAEILARLNHPQIVTIHDFGESDGLFFLVMEFVDGVNLREVLRDGPMEPAQALTIVPEICNALQYAHDQGIVHRDIKPENILLDRLGRVKVADFGIAKLAGVIAENTADGQPSAANLTEAGKVMGTPAYMAPEQVTSPENVDHRADIYALGAVFYQMLTGETPKTEAEPPSRKVSIDVRLDEIVLRALERNPSRRYQQVSEVRTKLETLTPVEKPKTKRVMWGCMWSAIAVSLFLTLLVISVFILVRSRLWEERQLAISEATYPPSADSEPKDANAWNGLGWTLFKSGKITEAIPAFEKAVALNPHQPGALNGLGQIALGRGDFGKAEEFLLRAAPKAPAAWFGLTRLYLLQEQFEKALPWAQKIADSGQGDDIAKRMLDAAKSKRLDGDLLRLISPAAGKPGVSNEPPQLRALAWLDNVAGGNAWKANGAPYNLSELAVPLSLATPTSVNVSETSAAGAEPRFLCLWVSQSDIDSLSVKKIKLLGPEGKPLVTPSQDLATGAASATPENQNVGWITATLCAGTMSATPSQVTIQLNYSGGPWQFSDHLTPDWQGFRALGAGVQLTAPGEGNDGMAFVQITRDTTLDTASEQWDFVAHTRDGRLLERRGLSEYGLGTVRTEQFRFDTPLSQVVRFEIRKRPIKTMVWNDVPLNATTAHTLNIRPDGSVVYGGETWTAEQMKEKLKAWGQETPQRPVLLRAAPDCPYTRITEILEACASAQLTNITFATEPP